jgi:hypothetical protein
MDIGPARRRQPMLAKIEPALPAKPVTDLQQPQIVVGIGKRQVRWRAPACNQPAEASSHIASRARSQRASPARTPRPASSPRFESDNAPRPTHSARGAKRDRLSSAMGMTLDCVRGRGSPTGPAMHANGNVCEERSQPAVAADGASRARDAGRRIWFRLRGCWRSRCGSTKPIAPMRPPRASTSSGMSCRATRPTPFLLFAAAAVDVGLGDRSAG